MKKNKVYLEELKNIVLSLTEDEIDYLYTLAENEEEKEFYNKLFNLSLQTKQKIAIKKGVF
jgi:hypothetical protein